MILKVILDVQYLLNNFKILQSISKNKRLVTVYHPLDLNLLISNYLTKYSKKLRP